jgi:hypothetical protein
MDELAAVCAPTPVVRAVTVSGTALAVCDALAEPAPRGAS